MKKTLPILATLAVSAYIASCSLDGNLSAALDLAGDNRAELEKVLSHYSGEPEKLQAAEWRSLGKRRSEGYELRYDNIPGGALLLLHDLTKGKEERPFTLQNGRQVWW